MVEAMIGTQNLANTPILGGEAGVILRADGSFQIFNTHELEPGKPLTAIQEEHGRKLRAICILLSIPSLMEMMDKFAEDPEIAGTMINIGPRH